MLAIPNDQNLCVKTSIEIFCIFNLQIQLLFLSNIYVKTKKVESRKTGYQRRIRKLPELLSSRNSNSEKHEADNILDQINITENKEIYFYSQIKQNVDVINLIGKLLS